MPRKILIIEDEEYIVDLYKFKLAKEGFEVLAAYNGEEGLALAEKVKPDLILLDLIMPKVDGYQVLRKLKANDKTKDIKVWIMTNLTHNNEQEKKLLDKADKYLIKANLTPSQLAETLKKVLP